MTPSITYLTVCCDAHGTVTISSTLAPDALDRRKLTPGEVLTRGFLQFAAKNGIDTNASTRHISRLQLAQALAKLDEKTDATPVAVAGPSEREAFEVYFPVFDGVYWESDTYRVKDDYVNSYRADRYVAQWEAWKARAARSEEGAST